MNIKLNAFALIIQKKIGALSTYAWMYIYMYMSIHPHNMDADVYVTKIYSSIDK